MGSIPSFTIFVNGCRIPGVMESCLQYGCRGICNDCQGVASILVARDPDEAQTIANAWEKSRGCICPSELANAVGLIRGKNTGGENQTTD